HQTPNMVANLIASLNAPSILSPALNSILIVAVAIVILICEEKRLITAHTQKRGFSGYMNIFASVKHLFYFENLCFVIPSFGYLHHVI
ncbi:MAG: hypothetical protein ACK52I_25980, partial [Pseudomonadota bacterium]